MKMKPERNHAVVRPSRRVLARAKARRLGVAAARREECPAAPAYADGHFTEPVRRWFGADWQPAWPALVNPREGDASRRLEVREEQALSGEGWGGGTIPMGGTPKNKRPGWL